jgi:hypothetical protein
VSSHLDPALVIGPLICSMLLVIAFEADAANAVVAMLTGIGGTMVTWGAGLRMDTLSRILVAWFEGSHSQASSATRFTICLTPLILMSTETASRERRATTGSDKYRGSARAI